MIVVTCAMFQENPLPDPSELFTNVYVKGFGTEVLVISSLLTLSLHISKLTQAQMLKQNKIMKNTCEVE